MELEVDPLPELRTRLRQVADDLAGRHDDVLVDAVVIQRSAIELGGGESSQRIERVLRVVLGARVAGGWREVTLADATESTLRAAVASFGRGRGRATRPARREIYIAAAPLIDPARVALSHWAARLAPLLARADALGDSRIVYRAAYLAVDDVEHFSIRGAIDAHERIVRSRAGVWLAARTGDELVSDRAEVAGPIGLEATEIPASAIAEAAERALMVLHTRGAPSGDTDIILAPQPAALFIHRCIADAFAGDLWAEGRSRAAALAGQRLANAPLTLFDDPRAPGAFGGYAFDDEGVESSRVELVRAGEVAAPFCDRQSGERMGGPSTGHGRRGPDGRVAPRPAHLQVASGTRSQSEMVASIERGLLLEEGLGAALEHSSWRCSLRGRLAREIVDGRLTGRLFDHVALVGDGPALLASLRAIGTDARASSVSEAAVATSRSSPSLLLRGRVLGGSL